MHDGSSAQNKMNNPQVWLFGSNQAKLMKEHTVPFLEDQSVIMQLLGLGIGLSDE